MIAELPHAAGLHAICMISLHAICMCMPLALSISLPLSLPLSSSPSLLLDLRLTIQAWLEKCSAFPVVTYCAWTGELEANLASV